MVTINDHPISREEVEILILSSAYDSMRDNLARRQREIKRLQAEYNEAAAACDEMFLQLADLRQRYLIKGCV